jgi:hypothetical protein
MKWYEIHDNLIVLYRYLVYVKKFDGERLLEVTIRPWKWEREFNEAMVWAATRDAVLAS